MTGQIIKKEFLLQLYSAKFLIMLLLVILLAVIGSLFMLQDYSLRLDNYEILRPDNGQTAALLPPQGMSIYVRGLDELLGRSTSVWSGFGRIGVDRTQSSENRLFMLFRQLDFQFIVTVVLSLAAMLFSFDAFSGEKQEGTLRLNLSNALGRSTLALGKWMSLVITTLIPYILAFLITLLFIFIALPDITGGDFGLRALMLFCGGALYLMSFVSIGMLISVFNSNRATSLVVGLLVWAVLVFALPNLLAMTARNSAGGKDLNSFFLSTHSIWLERGFKQSNSEFTARERVEFMGDTGDRLATVYQDYNNKLARQVDSLHTTAFLSPAQAFILYSWAVAGTGPADVQRHNQAIIRYQHQVMDESIQWELQNAAEPGSAAEFNFSPFQVEQQEADRAFLTTGVWMLAILLVYTCLAFAITVISFNRYDVR